ncbi:MAG: lipopolysaccharide assembly protein LapA domain-containing protein [Gammaproteobacteria bacterium]
MSRFLIIILFIFILFFGLIFHLHNPERVVFDYFISSGEFYFSVLMALSFAAGAILGMLANLPLIVRLKRERARLLKQVKVSEKEINNLRAIPVKDTP